MTTTHCQLYLISPLDVGGDFPARLEEALSAGPVAAFQFRVKNIDQHEAARLAEPLQATCTAHEVAFIVNDDVALAKRLKARILQASTSEVYGDPALHPQREAYWGNVNPVGRRSCYDEGKRCAETLFMDYRRQHGLTVKVARIFNTYGPRMHPNDGRVVSNFIVQALRGEPLTVYGRGDQTRSFCFVTDLIEALRLFMRSPPALAGPVNLGNPEEHTILELAEVAIELTGSKSPIVFKDLPYDDPARRRPDISLATAELGWRPTISLAEGMKRTIDYFDDLLSDDLRVAAPASAAGVEARKAS